MSKPPFERQALLLSLAAFGTWSIGDVATKLALESSGTVFAVLTFCGFFMAATMMWLTARRGQIRRLIPHNPRLVYLRALFAVANSGVNYMAMGKMSLASFYVVAFSAPLLGAIGSAIFLHEPLSRKKALIISCGFLGVLIAVNPMALWNGESSPLGYVLAFIGALFFVATQLIMRHLTDEEPAEVFVFSNGLMFFACGGLLWLMSNQSLSGQAVALLIFVGLCSAAANLFMAKATGRAPIAVVGSLHYSQLIFGALFGYLIWHDVPTLYLLVGASLILVSGLAMLRDTKS